MSSDQLATPVTEPESLVDLEKHKAVFLANGGKVQKIPYGYTAQTLNTTGQRLTLTQVKKLGQAFKEPKKEGWHQK